MKRRRFILILSGIAGAAATWLQDRRKMAASVPRHSSLECKVAGLFRDTRAAVDVGAAYLKVCPDENQLQLLITGSGLATHTPDRFEPEDLSRKTQQDFLEGNTLVFNGWLMARSEVYACALLAHLTASRSI